MCHGNDVLNILWIDVLNILGILCAILRSDMKMAWLGKAWKCHGMVMACHGMDWESIAMMS
jgi:hypothetical protein